MKTVSFLVDSEILKQAKEKAAKSGRSELDKTKYYCPDCGKLNIYEEQGDGDYYHGTCLYCLSCNFVFVMPIRWTDKTNVFIEDEK